MKLSETRINLDLDSKSLAKEKIKTLVNNKRGERETDVYIGVINLMVEIKGLIKEQGIFSRKKRLLQSLFRYCDKISFEFL